MGREQEQANQLNQELREELVKRSDETPAISNELTHELIEEFMPPKAYECRNTPPKPPCPHSGCPSRCGYEYWYDHGEVTQNLMEILAGRLGEDEKLYGAVGLIHDIDYLKYPHDRKDRKKESHPIPLVKRLIEINIHPYICLAVLEHAPHLKIKNNGKRSHLSYALTACEELATLLSTKQNTEQLNSLSEGAMALVDDMQRPPARFIDTTIIKPPRVMRCVDKAINVPLSILLKKITNLDY